MKKLFLTIALALINHIALALTPKEDVAATINLNGFACGNSVIKHNETKDENGNRTIKATCPDGKPYLITITNKGRVDVKPL